jgi:acyl CoA:acetate/3-ketoacid CoA transferase beta subunit
VSPSRQTRSRGNVPAAGAGGGPGGPISNTAGVPSMGMVGPHASEEPGVGAPGGPISRAEICVVACADAWRHDGEILASPFGTVPTLGARLAKLTTNPDLVLTDGEAALMADAPPLGTPPEALVREAAMPYRTVFDVVWSGRRHVMMMASQIDRTGNQNIAAIGDWDRPRAQLVGVRGAPGNSVNHPTSYWVPDHSPRSLVDRVDVVCGVGYERAAAAGPGATRYHDVRVVVTNLGVFDFDTPERVLRVRSLHPGVTPDEVRAATGFDLDVPEGTPESRRPTDGERRLLREVLDPRGTRDKEVRG